MKVIYMAHPVSGDVVNNLVKARAWIRWIETTYPDVAVNASWITECEIWDDSNPEHRKAGLKRDLAIIERCDELWLVGPRISTGMELERQHADKHGLIIQDFTVYKNEWPPGYVADASDGLWLCNDADEIFALSHGLPVHRAASKLLNVVGVIQRDDKVLVRKNSSGVYQCAGGPVHVGETLRESLLRQVQEQIGLDVKSAHVIELLDSDRGAICLCMIQEWEGEVQAPWEWRAKSELRDLLRPFGNKGYAVELCAGMVL